MTETNNVDDFNSENGLKKYFARYLNENERAFDLDLTKLARRKGIGNLEENLKKIIGDDISEDKNIKYCAFFCLATKYRHDDKETEMKTLLSEYRGDKFGGKRDSYEHLFLLYRLSFVSYSLNFTDIDRARYNRDKYRHNAGYIHIFADIIATAYEKNKHLEKGDDNYFKKHIKEAIMAVEEANDKDPNYAKYYSTWARLLFLQGDQEGALEKIDMAIKKETVETIDYISRVNNYNRYKLDIMFAINEVKIIRGVETIIGEKVNSASKEIDTRIKEMNSALENNKYKIMEFVGFFAGIITLVIGSLEIVNNQPFEKAIMLIVALFGTLLCVFSAFGIIVRGFRRMKSLPNRACQFFCVIDLFERNPFNSKLNGKLV